MGRTINSLAILPGFTRMSHKNIKLETLFNDSLENSYSKFKLVHEQLSWIRTNKEACFEAYLTETPYWNFNDTSCGKYVKSGDMGCYLFQHEVYGKQYAGEGGIHSRVKDKRKKFIILMDGYSFDEWNGAKKLYAFDKNINNWKVKAYIIDTGNKIIDKILAKELEDTLKIKYNLIEGGLNTQVGSNT